MAESKNELPPARNYRDAFCRTYRCRLEAFERKVFWKTLCRRAYLPVMLMGGLDPVFFQKDIETIRAVGDASTLEEFERVLQDFSSMQHVERSLRRRMLRFRISGTRLAELFQGMEALIVSPAEGRGAASITAKETPRANLPAADVTLALPGGDPSIGALRKLKRSHELITSGRPISEVLGELRFTEAEFETALNKHASSRPELLWLRTHLLERRELETLRSENARLRAAFTDLAIHGEQRVSGVQ